MKWLELKIDAAPAGLEPVSALLEDLGITGLVIDDEGDFQDFLEHNHAYWDYVDDQLMQEKKGLCRITFYLEDSPDGYNTLAQVRMALSRVKQEHPEYGRLLLTMENMEDADWENNWKQFYKPMEIGDRLIVIPEWESTGVPEDRVALRLNPGLTFGTGSHATTDDPSCHSSQNEQDNRHYARAAKIAMVEPSDAQECKDFVALACEVSELFDTPVLYRTTTRVCHSKGLVEFGERREHTHAPYARNVCKFVCTPAHAYANHPIVEERLKKLEEYGCTRALENGLNRLEMGDGKVGVVTSSIAYEYAKEVFPEGTSFLKLGLTFPLPMDLIRDFASRVEKLYVIEELEPFMEDQIKAAGIPCVGKELTGPLYELNTQLLRERVLGQKADFRTVDVTPAKRPPALCPGCPHRGFFYTLSRNKNYVVTGDIGCYTLGCAEPLNCMDSVVCMGAGFSAGMGIAKSFEKEGVTGKVVFGVVGDSTFFHSGMTGAAEIVYNKGRMIPCVLDNRITGMTGHQDNPGTGYTLQGDPTALLSVEKILTALGFAPVLTVDPQDLKAMKAAVDQAVSALDAGQQPAIVTRRPCLLIKRVKHDTGMCVVNADKCKSCKSCLKVGCPAISMENGKAVIDRTQCAGCTVCAQVCPFDAIEKEEN